MDREIFEQLKQYEQILHHAYYDSFCRITNNAMKADLARLHKEQFGNDGNIIGGCNRCILNALRNLGKEYFKEKKIVQEEEKQKEKERQKEAEQITELVENKAKAKPKPKTKTTKK